MARRATLVAALAILIGGLVGSERSEGRPPAPLGYFGVSGWNTDESDFARMQGADVGVYRALFPLRMARPVRGEPLDWRYFDGLVSNTARNGMDLLPVVYGVPGWLSEERESTPVHDPVARREWHDVLLALVERYGPDGDYWEEHPEVPARPIEVWQIWNEPNSKTWWGPRPDPAEYGTLLRRSDRTIHAADPEAQVLTAGIVARPTNPDAITGPQFLRELFARADVRAAVDAVAYHPYAPTMPTVRRQMKKMHRVLNRSRVDVPVWVTEVGWGTEGPKDHPLIKTKVGQRRALEETFEMLLRQRRRLDVDRVLWFLWQDRTTPLCLWCESSGLLDQEANAKRLLTTFRDIATAP